MQNILGIALDIGTTTVQGNLIDLKEKKGLSYFSSLNEQLSCGHDIISRIKFCLDRPEGLSKLHKKAISSINFVIENLLSMAGADSERIFLIAAVGNTASYYFTLSLSPERLIEPPYQPEHKNLVEKRAEALGIKANKDCRFNFLPNVGGFVGSDAVAVILATGLDRSASPLLAVDIGTNGEIILGSKKRILVASTAAGPAFEGWHMSCGMRAVEGAVESIEDIDGRLDLKVIGGREPRGISGSGLIDIIAILLNRGYIDKSGGMKGDFVIYDNHKDRKLSLSQDDVRGMQLAKAAFSAGIRYLRRLSKKEITKFFITGNFGNYLNKENARITGLIPQDVELERVKFIENGALKGAEVFINDKESTISRIDDILRKTEHISLSQDKDFRREFIEAMGF